MVRHLGVCVCHSEGIEAPVSPEVISMSSDSGATRIAIWLALGATGWAVLLSVVLLTARLVT